jgi:hypothetical protein
MGWAFFPQTHPVTLFIAEAVPTSQKVGRAKLFGIKTVMYGLYPEDKPILGANPTT